MNSHFQIATPKRLTSLRSVDESGVNTEFEEPPEKIILDTTKCTFAEPFALLYFAYRIRELRRLFPETEWFCKTSGTDFNGYADHIGFFDFIDLPGYWSKTIGEAKANSNYMPLETWSIQGLKTEAGADPIGSLMHERALALTKVLLQESSGDVFEIVHYAIREITRNAVEHSEGDQMAFLAQCWPSRGEAEIAIADDGIGIAENIYDNEFVDVSNNLAAIKTALLPGITGVPRAERINQDSDWNNSGYGLFVTSRVAGKFGNFLVASGGDYLELTHKMQVARQYPHSGTLVGIRLNLKQLGVAKEFIKKTISQGEKTQTEVLKNFPISASVASKMLLSDFKKIS